MTACPMCGGGGVVTECANDGTHGCSHTFDREYDCSNCDGTGTPRYLDECSYCDAVIEGEPFYDEVEVSWCGKANSRTWCNADCQQNAAEAAHERMAESV